jgi:hypothetical protein
MRPVAGGHSARTNLKRSVLENARTQRVIGCNLRPDSIDAVRQQAKELP